MTPLPEQPPEPDTPWPVLALIGGRGGQGGQPCCALMNRKAYRKSIESGTPWIVHPRTGRVLPWPGSPPIHRLTEAPGHFRLELPKDAADNPYGDTPPPNADPDNRAQVQLKVKVTQSPPDAPSAAAPSATVSSAAAPSVPASSETAPSAAEPSAAAPPEPTDKPHSTSAPPINSAQTDILTRLNALIAERRETMPSGSYTTHLFESGPSKIRKKLGEEAVELILAQEPTDVIYESADLIYHLQVLLRALDIEWSDLIGELARRAAEPPPR